jgi:alkaline phosphatase
MARAWSVYGVMLTAALAGCGGRTMVDPVPPPPPGPASVIFLHPDGTGANSWGAARMLLVGPDADLNWDKLPHMALYRGHMKDALAGTSNGGGTVHAYGVRVRARSFGTDGAEPVRDAQGRPVESVAAEALRRGKAVGLVNSASIVDAGTGVFLASVPDRGMYTEIARQMLEKKPHVLLGGGERYFLPKGVMGRHAEGVRDDGRNLVDEARAAGYTVVFTADELRAVPPGATRLLGLFAPGDTFLDAPEEDKARDGSPYYRPGAPGFAQMVNAALRVLETHPGGFLLVAEEEGTDNFGGKNNAKGTLMALQRADEGIGVALEFLERRPRTLVMVAADSDAGGMQVRSDDDLSPDQPLPARDENDSPLDGRDGTGTPPFLAAPDASGRRLPFAIAWASFDDVAGGILVRGAGFMAPQLVRGSMHNTDVNAALRRALFGEQ